MAAALPRGASLPCLSPSPLVALVVTVIWVLRDPRAVHCCPFLVFICSAVATVHSSLPLWRAERATAALAQHLLLCCVRGGGAVAAMRALA